MKAALKRLAPERLRLYVRRAGRLRWLTKTRVLRETGPGAWAGRPLRQARYVLLDPEVDTFTYTPANRDELIAPLARLLDRPADELAGYLAEALVDPEMGSAIARDIGWRVVFLKRRQLLAAHHLSAWIVIRARKPRLVVETGILEGLGSRTMLRALQLNHAEGSGGQLMSFDILPGAGEPLVPERLRGAWEPVYEPTPGALAEHLVNRSVDFFLHDSVPSADHLRAEIDAVTPHATPGAVLMTAAGWNGALQEIAAAGGASFESFQEHPRDHFYNGNAVTWMRLADPPPRLPEL